MVSATRVPEVHRNGARTPRVAALLTVAIVSVLAPAPGIVAAAQLASPPEEVTLRNGVSMPTLVLGTYDLSTDDGECLGTLQAALELGYRHFDTAPSYGVTERCIGVAINRAVLSGVVAGRHEVFVTTKIPGSLAAEGIQAGFRLSLKRLGMEYVDLLLVHWPAPTAWERASVWREMRALLAAGKARAVGVSNYNEQQLAELFGPASGADGFVGGSSDVNGIPDAELPAVNQIELNPHNAYSSSVQSLRRACGRWGIIVQAYTPFGEPSLLQHAAVMQASQADPTRRSPAQLLLWWSRMHLAASSSDASATGIVVPVFKTSKRERLVQNAEGLLADSPAQAPPPAKAMQLIDTIGRSSTTSSSTSPSTSTSTSDGGTSEL